jgi:hypothetical protein
MRGPRLPAWNIKKHFTTENTEILRKIPKKITLA